MNFHFIPHDTVYPEIRYPEIDVGAVRDAAHANKGDAAIMRRHDGEFISVNSTVSALATVRVTSRDIKVLEGAVKRLRRKQRGTEPTSSIVTSERIAKQSLIVSIETLFLTAISVGALAAGNTAIAQYIANSDVPLAPGDMVAARIIAAVVVLGAVGLKIAERQFGSDAGRKRFRKLLTMVGLLSLCGWILAASVGFAPNLEPSTLLAPPNDNQSVTSLLVATQLFCDLTLSCVAYSHAEERFLSNRKRIEIPNPRYETLVRAVADLETRIADKQQVLQGAEDYIARVAAAREVNKEVARGAYQKARDELEQAVKAAQAFAVGSFLKS